MTTTNHLGPMLTHLSQHWEQRHAATRSLDHLPAPTWTIALAREAGASGTTIAREVAARLHWQVYDHELLEQIAQDMGVRSNLLKSVDERRQPWVEEAPGNLHGDAAGQQERLRAPSGRIGAGAGNTWPKRHRRPRRPVYSAAGHDVAHRIVAHRHDRVHRVRRMLGLSQKEAERETERIDHERVSFTKSHFFKDATDPDNYDLVLNSSRFSTTECAECIIAALHCLQARGRQKTEG